MQQPNLPKINMWTVYVLGSKGGKVAKSVCQKKNRATENIQEKDLEHYLCWDVTTLVTSLPKPSFWGGVCTP